MENEIIKYYRLDLIDFEYDILAKYFNTINESEVDEEDLHFFKTLKNKISNPKKIKHSSKKATATEKATATRIKAVKNKIINAVNLLKMQNQDITIYSVAKTAGVSYTTAKKYLKTFNEMK